MILLYKVSPAACDKNNRLIDTNGDFFHFKDVRHI